MYGLSSLIRDLLSLDVKLFPESSWKIVEYDLCIVPCFLAPGRCYHQCFFSLMTKSLKPGIHTSQSTCLQTCFLGYPEKVNLQMVVIISNIDVS